MAYLLGASGLLAMEKPSGGVRPIAVGETSVFFVTYSRFYTPSAWLQVLGTPIGSDSFQASFVRDALEVDVSTIHQLSLLGDPQVAFGLLSHCYV
ncbi:hypothetical protein R1flu_021487 [Riccia fluitans]|uniref:Uncharacterized protein n=1 Tax=Riccia fluitans TaxID=41844 RepID=A0ABD1ZSQ3_9MARC